MEMCLKEKLIGKILSKIIEKMIKKQFGVDVQLTINDLRINADDQDTNFLISATGKTKTTNLYRLVTRSQ